MQKYPCLYNNENKGYKERERDPKVNAWRAVEQELSYKEDNYFFLIKLITTSLNNGCGSTLSYSRRSMIV